jgi:hypothetical protein
MHCDMNDVVVIGCETRSTGHLAVMLHQHSGTAEH